MMMVIITETYLVGWFVSDWKGSLEDTNIQRIYDQEERNADSNMLQNNDVLFLFFAIRISRTRC